MNAVDIRQGEDLRDLYRELILDHARNPRHFHKLDAATHSAEAGPWRSALLERRGWKTRC